MANNLTNVINSHIPASAVTYCYDLWKHYGFQFRVVKPRRSRLGDFRVLPKQQTQITVNANLNPYAFLITYVHEVAHADVHEQQRRLARRPRVQPHGIAWQTAFQRLMLPLLTEVVFPPDVLQPLRAYLTKPAATTYANPALMLALRQYDPVLPTSESTDRMLVKDVPEGRTFRLAQKMFVRGTLRRTRVVCKEVPSGKSYAVLAHAWVNLEP